MNCNLCGLHILATMQIVWQGKNFHAECVGEAVVKQRTENQEDSEIKEAFEGFDDDFEQQFDNEFDEDIGDLEPDEDLDEHRVIVPEIMPQIVHQVRTNGEIVGSFEMPPGGIIAAPRAIIHPPTNGTTTDVPRSNVGTLIAAKDTRFVSREFLATIPKPVATDTFKPIPHDELIQLIMDSLWYRRMNVVRDEYAVSTDGMKMFGLIELDIEYKGVRFAIGIRNANDRSMRVAMTAGYKVTVCSNMMFQGDFNPMLSKHSKNFEIQDALSIACDRIQRNFGNLHQEIATKQEKRITPGFARELCYKAFTDGKFPISLMRTVHKEYFDQPSYQEFEEPTMWSLENAFTSAFKKLEPVAQFQATAKLGKFLAAY